MASKIKTSVFFILLFSFFNQTLSAQVAVGPRFDISGFAFDGEYNPFTYNPIKKLSISINGYRKGYYYDNETTKHEKNIDIKGKNIHAKDINSPASLSEKIDIKNIKALVIEVDSFFRVDHLIYKKKSLKKPKLLQYIATVNGHEFAKYYHYKRNSLEEKVFYIKPKGENNWVSFSDDQNFEKMIRKYFGHIPIILNNVKSGKYKIDNLFSIIKTAEYYEKYVNQETISFNEFWQETRTKNAKYSATIKSIKDSIWTLSYSDTKKKLFDIDYTSFYPHTKNGIFTSYHPNKSRKQIIKYVNNKIKKVKLFNDENSLIKEYDLKIHKRNNYRSTPYFYVSDSLNVNLINSKYEFLIRKVDTVSNCTYFNQYRKNTLVHSYKIHEKDTVFQVINNYNFKLDKLQKKLFKYMMNTLFSNKILKNTNGKILLSIILNKKGRVLDCKIMNKLHPVHDKFIRDFVNKKVYRHRFMPYKKLGKKYSCEFILAIDFDDDTSFQEHANYNNFWFHQQMFQQQMMMNQMNQMQMSVPRF